MTRPTPSPDATVPGAIPAEVRKLAAAYDAKARVSAWSRNEAIRYAVMADRASRAAPTDQPEAPGVEATLDNTEPHSLEFMQWLWRAYRQPSDGNLDARMFTRWNMEVAYNAGLEAAEARVASVRAESVEEWQPIETAPKGEVLLYFPPSPGRHTLPAMIAFERHPVTYPRKPTHWMPAPPAPKQDGA